MMVWSGPIRRKPFGVLGSQIDDQADSGDGFVIKPANAEPANFDQAGERGGGPHQQAPVMRLDVNPVVADQAREGQGRFAAPPMRAAICRRRRVRGSARPWGRSKTAEAWMVWSNGELRSFPRKRESSSWQNPGPRFRGDERDNLEARFHFAGSRTTKRAPSIFGVAAGAVAVLGPQACRHALRRSAWRSTGRGRNSGRSPAPAGRYRSDRKFSPARRG